MNHCTAHDAASKQIVELALGLSTAIRELRDASDV
jgi:hypothetical protein